MKRKLKTILKKKKKEKKEIKENMKSFLQYFENEIHYIDKINTELQSHESNNKGIDT